MQRQRQRQPANTAAGDENVGCFGHAVSLAKQKASARNAWAGRDGHTDTPSKVTPKALAAERNG
jgi:hypothetical protein